MGTVYRAVREAIQIVVAIKLLKRGTDIDATLSCFRAERQMPCRHVSASSYSGRCARPFSMHIRT